MNAEGVTNCHSIVDATDVSITHSVEYGMRSIDRGLMSDAPPGRAVRVFCSQSLSKKTFPSASRCSRFPSRVPANAVLAPFPSFSNAKCHVRFVFAGSSPRVCSLDPQSLQKSSRLFRFFLVCGLRLLKPPSRRVSRESQHRSSWRFFSALLLNEVLPRAEAMSAH